MSSTEAGIVVGKAMRSYLIDRLERAELCGYEKAFLEALKQSRCSRCSGSGNAPYVGGDDDDAPCITCKGSGFDPENKIIKVGSHEFRII